MYLLGCQRVKNNCLHMSIFLLLLTVLCFLLNLNAPADLTFVNKGLLGLEFLGVIVAGKGIINGLLSTINENYRDKLFCAFLFFFSMCLLYLYFSWTPYLSINSNTNWGFDPQRYYYYATQLIRTTGYEFAVNYGGIVFIYKYLMMVFGIDPMVPLFINVILITLTIAVLTKILYKFYGEGSCYRYTWMFFFFPEVIFYSSVSSREIFCLVLVSICVYIAASQPINNRRSLIMMILLIFGQLIVRPPFALVLSLVLLLSPIKKKASIAIMGFIVLVVSIIGSDLDFGSQRDATSMAVLLSDHVSGNIDANDSFNYGSNSITQKLIPHNPIEFVVFGVIRSLLYLIPRANPLNIISDVFISGYNMGSLLVWISSFIMMLFIPSLWRALRGIKTQDIYSRTVFIAFCAFFFAVGMLNSNLIHERYRLVYDFLLLTVWLLVRQQRLKLKFKKRQRRSLRPDSSNFSFDLK